MKILEREIIKVTNVSFGYDGNDVLKDVSFCAQRGDFLCITGINGAGKTTLLKLLLKTLKPSSGTISIDYTGNKISYVPQKAASFNPAFPATAAEITALGLYPEKNKAKIAGEVKAALKKVNLQGCENKLIGKLSGGQQQRVFIAKALISSPDILLLDEPTTGIDRDSLGDICCLLGDINKNYNITVLMVTHDIASIINHANKVLYFGGDKVSLLSSAQYRNNIFHAGMAADFTAHGDGG